MVVSSKSLFVFGLLIVLSVACSTYKSVHFESNRVHVLADSSTVNEVSAIVQPYKSLLEGRMNEVVGYASCDLLRNRPEGNLGNFVADLVLDFAQPFFRDSGDVSIIAILNHGGLRTPISAGEIQLRHVFELMPFDNELVFLKLKASEFSSIYTFLKQTGGEPIAGFTYQDSVMQSDFWVVTSDYLAEGGDEMGFFGQSITMIKTGRLLRDEIISHIRKSDTICIQNDGRWR
jgi:2',3'-cyclic-nucleotide 2'-phosphodiesterase (5'-nucleotidase family)